MKLAKKKEELRREKSWKGLQAWVWGGGGFVGWDNALCHSLAIALQ